MNSLVNKKIRFKPNAQQFAKCLALQEAFASICNAIVPYVVTHRCWNRVALHHLAYYDLRKQFPEIGSQMVCNAIYSVCRSYRQLLAYKELSINLADLEGLTLPKLIFLSQAPVYFDRHTLNIKNGRLSLYTLEGRMRFSISITPEEEFAIKTGNILDMVMRVRSPYVELNFIFGEREKVDLGAKGKWPEYLVVDHSDAASIALLA